MCFLNLYGVSPSSSNSCLESCFPDSIYFFALSHAPPVLLNEIAIYTPETISPANKPLTALVPKNNPTKKGVIMTRIPGAIIFLIEALVEMAMQRS